MKVYGILFITAFINYHAITAQVFKTGLTGGMSTTQYDGDNYSGYNKIGLSAGGFVRTDINDRWAFQFEIIYIQKGSIRNPRPDKGYYRQYKLKLNYMEIPLLFKYKYKNLVFETGIGLGALIKVSEEADYLDITGIRPFNKTELSFNLGLNYPLTDDLAINWRYTYSILPVRPFPAGTTYVLRLGETNNVITFTLKYTFGGKKEENAQ